MDLYAKSDGLVQVALIKYEQQRPRQRESVWEWRVRDREKLWINDFFSEMKRSGKENVFFVHCRVFTHWRLLYRWNFFTSTHYHHVDFSLSFPVDDIMFVVWWCNVVGSVWKYLRVGVTTSHNNVTNFLLSLIATSRLTCVSSLRLLSNGTSLSTKLSLFWVHVLESFVLSFSLLLFFSLFLSFCLKIISCTSALCSTWVWILASSHYLESS